MSKVLLLDMTKEPLDPVHPGRARLLLKEGKAAVYRRYPFTLILKRQIQGRRRAGWPWSMTRAGKWCGRQNSAIGEPASRSA